MSMDQNLLNYLIPDYYLWNASSEHTMIIEQINITSDAEDGNKLLVSGRSLESILDRRIIWGQAVFSGNLQEAIRAMLYENIINPSIVERRIDNFVFHESMDEQITSLTINAQYTGDNLYDVICTLCEKNNIGFKIILNEANEFVFNLYAGVDRSYGQSSNPYVIFSPSYENIINSSYLESKKGLKNVALVAGEGEGASRRTAIVGASHGLERRELFTDARDISSDIGRGSVMPDAQYSNQLVERGADKLSENISVTFFEGEVEATSSQTENNNGSTRQKAKLDFLILTSANKPISDTLTFKFVNKNHPEEVVEITSKDGMLTSSQLYTNEEYNISIKDNKKYSFDPIDVVLKKEEGYYILYNAKSERIINHLDLKVKKESTASTSKHLSLDSISAKVLDKNNQVIDSVPTKLSEFNNNTPNIVKESKTSKDGIVIVKSSDLKPNTKYELKIEKNDTTFSRDSLVFTTDDKGRISNLDNKAVTDKTSDVVEFKEEVKNKQKEKIGTISNVLVMSKEQQVIDELEFELVSKSDPKDVIVVKSVKGELSKVPVKMGDKYTLRIKNSKKYTYQQDIEIHDEGGEAIPFLSGTEEPLAKIYLAEK